MWEVEKLISNGKYTYAVVRDHPNAIEYGYVAHHRVVMENHIGRLLDTNETVHHIDGNGKNNDISNLQLLTNEEHARLHANKRGRLWVKLRCPNCGKIFEREHNKTFLCIKEKKRSFCSRKCSGEFGTKESSEDYVIEIYRKYAPVSQLDRESDF